MERCAYHVINVKIINVHMGQILPCGQVTGNELKEFKISGLNLLHLINTNKCEWLYQNPPHMHTMAKNGFHHQLIAPSIS